MKRILLPVLVIGVLLLGACGGPSEPATDEPEATEPEGSPSQTTVILEFGELGADDEPAKWENELGRWKPATAIIDGEEIALTSQHFKKNTYVTIDEQGIVLLIFEWTDEGSQLCEQITGRLIGQPLGIFEGDEALKTADGQPIAPVVGSVIKESGCISDLSLEDATALSTLLNASQ